MGAVYLGRDPNIGRLIAIKVLHGHLSEPTLRQRFVQEARSAGSLQHPNIVTIHDFGDVDGAPYIVMEYVRGANLAALIKKREPIALATKLEWLEGLCAGLRYAHDARIIHRDVKPQNLMVDERGTLKILDFGIARVAESGLTKMSQVVGTPGYMSPEQIDGRAIDRRSDIFSAGAVGYALISYREAFAGDTIATIMHRVLTAEPPPLTTVCEGLPIAVERIIERALRKEPAERFQDIGDMRRALEQARRSQGADAVEPKTAPLPAPAGLDRRTPGSRTDPAEIARRRAEQIRQHVQEAELALDRRDLAAVEAACEAVLLVDPDNPDAHRLLGQLHDPPTEAVAVPEAYRTPARPDPGGSQETRRVPVPAVDTPRPPGVPPPPPSLGLPSEPDAPAGRRWRLYGGVAAAAMAGLVILANLQQSAAPVPPATAGAAAPEAGAGTQQAPAEAPSESEPDRLMREGRTLEEQEQWAEARARYQAVLALAPSHALASEGVSRIAARLKPAAPPAVTPPPADTGVTAEDRVRANGLVRRATGKYEAGDYDGAIEDLNRAVEAVPSLDAARGLLNKVLLAKDAEAKIRRRPPGDLLFQQ